MKFVGRPKSDVDRPVEYSIVDFDARADDPEAVLARVSQWLDSPEMATLFEIFDNRLADGSLRERLFHAEAITHDVFDFRQGGERWEARKTVFDDQTAEATDAVIAALYREPIASAATEIGAVDHALVLGGRIGSCLLRGELLRRLTDEGASVGHVWGLGSRRPVTEEEIEIAMRVGDFVVADELDAMAVALRRTLRLPASAPPDRDAESEVRVLAAHPLPVTGLAAARGEGKVRATTSDTYKFFLETAGDIGTDSHLLIVTSAIHAPFQHAQAVAELGLVTGATITSVGAHVSTTREASVRHDWTTAEWLQEVRSTIWSMKAMYLALEAANPGLSS